MKKILMILLAGMFIAGCGSNDTGENENENNTGSDTQAEETNNKTGEAEEGEFNSEEEEQSNSEEEEQEEVEYVNDHEIERVGHDIFGERLENIKTYEGKIYIDAQMKPELAEPETLKGFEQDIVQYLDVIQDDDFVSITFLGFFDMEDEHGEIENMDTVKIVLTREEVDEINFSNSDELEKIAKVYAAPQEFRE